MLWIVDINREVPQTSTKNADKQSGDLLLFYPTEKHRHRKSIVPGIVRSWICPLKPGAYTQKVYFKFTVRADRPQKRTLNSQAGLDQKTKSKKKKQSHSPKIREPCLQQEKPQSLFTPGSRKK